MDNQAFRIGGHLGYDWQFGSIWIAGADYGTTSYVNTVVTSPGGGLGPFVYKDTYSLRMQTNTVTLGFSYKFWDGLRG